MTPFSLFFDDSTENMVTIPHMQIHSDNILHGKTTHSQGETRKIRTEFSGFSADGSYSSPTPHNQTTRRLSSSGSSTVITNNNRDYLLALMDSLE